MFLYEVYLAVLVSNGFPSRFLVVSLKPPLCSAVYIVHHMLSALPDLPTQYQIYHQVMLHEASHMAYSPANVRTRIT